jgi:hypothetical protein
MMEERTLNRHERELLRHTVAAGSCTLDVEAPPDRPWFVLAEGRETIRREFPRQTGSALLAAGLLCGASLHAGRFVSFVPTPAGRVAVEGSNVARVDPGTDDCRAARRGGPRQPQSDPPVCGP